MTGGASPAMERALAGWQRGTCRGRRWLSEHGVTLKTLDAMVARGLIVRIPHRQGEEAAWRRLHVDRLPEAPSARPAPRESIAAICERVANRPPREAVPVAPVAPAAPVVDTLSPADRVWLAVGRAVRGEAPWPAAGLWWVLETVQAAQSRNSRPDGVRPGAPCAVRVVRPGAPAPGVDASRVPQRERNREAAELARSRRAESHRQEHAEAMERAVERAEREREQETGRMLGVANGG